MLNTHGLLLPFLCGLQAILAAVPSFGSCPNVPGTSNISPLLSVIVRSIRPQIELQFQIHREGWRIQIARGAEGPESYLDSPAFEMDLKLF